MTATNKEIHCCSHNYVKTINLKQQLIVVCYHLISLFAYKCSDRTRSGHADKSGFGIGLTNKMSLLSTTDLEEQTEKSSGAF